MISARENPDRDMVHQISDVEKQEKREDAMNAAPL